MTVVISDLVARFRADTSDLQRGAQQSQQSLQGITQEAQNAGAAVDNIARVAQNLRANGASLAETAAALRGMGASAAQAQAAVQQIGGAADQARTAAQGLGDGFSVSNNQLVRIGAGLAGVSLGINVAAGLARQLHDVIAGIVEGQLTWERSVTQTRAVYGDLAPQLVAISQAQANAPGLLGSQSEFLAANARAAILSRQYGIPLSVATGLTSAAGALSNTLGNDPQQRAALQAAALQFARQGGGASLEQYGIIGTPYAVAQAAGLRSEQALQALTPGQLTQIAALQATIGLSQAALQGREGQPGLLAARTALKQRISQLQGGVQTVLEAPGGVIPEGGGYGAAAGGAIREMEDLRRQLQANTDAIQVNQQTIADNTRQLAQLGVSAGGAAAQLLTFTGSPEFTGSIARGDIAAQAQAAVAARARSSTPAAYMSDVEIQRLAANQGEQQAYQNFVAAQAQAEQASAVREYLQRVGATGALQEADRRTAANAVGLQAQRAGALADRAATEAQAQLTQIQLGQDERRLAVAQDMARIRGDELQTEGQIAPLLLQQAELQDRMLVAARDNLQTRRELLTAQQAALGPQQVTSAYDYEQQRLELRAEQSRAIVRQGGQPTEDISALREQYRALDLQRAASGADLAALDTQHQVQVAQQQATADQLQREQTLTDLEQQSRTLQDQLIPLEERARANQASADALQRSLDLTNLQDVAAQTAAQHQLDSAEELRLKTDEVQRLAQDYANGMDLGATAADRAAEALSRGYAAANDMAVAIASVRDMLNSIGGGSTSSGTNPVGDSDVTVTKRSPGRNYDIWPGTPQGPLSGVTSSTTPTGAASSPSAQLVFNISGPNWDGIRQEIVDHFNAFISGATSAGSPAPSTVSGAGR